MGERIAAVRIENLRFRPGREADYILDVDGCFVFYGPGLTAIVGENGAGKSTLLKCLTGEQRGYQGRIQVMGIWLDALKTDAQRQRQLRRIGVIPQDPAVALWEGLTLDENLHRALQDGGVDSRIMRQERIGDVLAKLGLEEHQMRTVKGLSGGERQRAVIAMALGRQVGVIFADEPTAAIDPKHREEAFGVFQEIARERPVVMVTHDTEFAAGCDQRFEMVKPGALHRVGPRRMMAAAVKISDTQLALRRLAEKDVRKRWTTPIAVPPRLPDARTTAVSARSFFQSSTREFRENLGLVGEDATLAVLVGMVSGQNIVLFGSSAEAFAEFGHRIVRDVSDADVATVPPRRDISERDLLGTQMEVVRPAASASGPVEGWSEPGLIRSSTKVVRVVGVNLVNPLAVKSLDSVWAERSLGTRPRPTELSGLLYSISTFAAGRQGGFELSPKAVSRHSLGAVVLSDRDSIGGLRGTVGERAEEYRSRHRIVPTTDTAALLKMRKSATAGTIIDLLYGTGTAVGTRILPAIGAALTNLVQRLRDALEAHDQPEAPQRLATQMLAIARTLSLFDGRVVVSEEDARRAARFVLTARLGMLAFAHLAPPELSAAIEDVWRTEIENPG